MPKKKKKKKNEIIEKYRYNLFYKQEINLKKYFEII